MQINPSRSALSNVDPVTFMSCAQHDRSAEKRKSCIRDHRRYGATMPPAPLRRRHLACMDIASSISNLLKGPCSMRCE
eukprot:5321199-Pleurochrysis_carterae.AAC.1